jgi:hypothetical protein
VLAACACASPVDPDDRVGLSQADVQGYRAAIDGGSTLTFTAITRGFSSRFVRTALTKPVWLAQ